MCFGVCGQRKDVDLCAWKSWVSVVCDVWAPASPRSAPSKQTDKTRDEQRTEFKPKGYASQSDPGCGVCNKGTFSTLSRAKNAEKPN
ncbi:hypothetical protein L596_020455 [Steinernema carpocapsae]|uniref:Uncharacterized protein n=1 Tax=Steinernema carpocapsae TaxID=34508 RepID=A0A4U5MTS4_STECR|nr:hypothetical protein L596_020455 [Steinernema carpocapsae]